MARQTAMLVTFILAVLGFVLVQASQGASGISLVLIFFYGLLPAAFLAIMVGAAIPSKDDH
ncbi:MAG TPA: hypothetical protein PKA37_16205 [Planctomycetota bacterium]|nr:hypothetical protein [Planctomycetota bacterium]